MATRRIKDITNTATTFASDDFIALDGATQGTRKMDKDDLIAEVSAGVSGDYLEEANNLSDVASLDTSKLNMEIPDVGTAPNEVPLNGMLGDMAYQSSDGVSVAELEVTDKVTGNLGVGVSPDDYDASGRNLVVGNTASNGGITVVASPSHTSSLLFADGTGTPDRYVGGMTYEHTSNAQKFYTSGNLAATIDSAGRLGISNSSPSSFHGNADDLVVGDGSGGRGVTIASGVASSGSLFFADGTAGDAAYRGQIQYAHGSDTMYFATAGASAWSINSSGNFVAATGKGIDFGSAASGSGTPITNGGLLNDYESGTFTPTDGSGAGLSFTGAAGTYIKVGGQVTCWGILNYPTNSDATPAAVQGLPFPFGANNVDRVGGPVVYNNFGGYLSVLGVTSNSKVQIFKTTGSGPTNAQLSAQSIWFCVTYNVS